MTRRHSRRLVIDASVLRAAGPPESTHPTGAMCREFLASVLVICHRVVVTPAIAQEWRKHSSRTAVRWKSAMQRRGKLIYQSEVDETALRDVAERAPLELRARDAAEKDLHLVSAAQQADRVVVSLDDRASAAFRTIAGSTGRLRSLLWVNPTASDNAIRWLEEGATVAAAKRLKCGSVLGAKD